MLCVAKPPGIDALLGAASEHGGLLFGDSGDEGFGLVDAADPINPPPAKKAKAPGVYVGMVVVGSWAEGGGV